MRRFVGDFYAKVLGDEEITSRLVVATHELLENAVRYSLDGQSAIRIGVNAEGPAVLVHIETRNRGNEEHRRAVCALVDEMRQAPDREAFYMSLLRRSAKREVGSGLGLGRILAESEMDVVCEIASDVIRIRAQASFPKACP